MRYFDWERAARQAGIPDDKLAEIGRALRREFPQDDMLYELHLLRVCMAVGKGWISLADALAPSADRSPARG